MSSALVVAGLVVTARSCPGLPCGALRIADGNWAMIPGGATSTGLPRRDQRAGDAAPPPDERPSQGRGNLGPATPDHRPATATARPEDPVHPRRPGLARRAAAPIPPHRATPDTAAG